jgi:hypothetical protein
MYIDGVVLLSLLIVVLTCVVIGYVGVFAYKHIKSESAKYDLSHPLEGQ